MREESNRGQIEILIPQPSGSAKRFRVETTDTQTVLDALEKIRTGQNADLLYRHSCHHGSCGTCGMIVNGERRLACLTSLEDVGSPVELQPLPPFPAVRDLAVDPAPFYDDLPEDSTYVRDNEFSAGSHPPEEIARFSRFEDCIECGLCESACPVSEQFLGPAALAMYHREIEKHAEREEKILREIDAPNGVWGCQRHIQCSLVCPSSVAPARRIAQMKRAIKRPEK